MPSSVSRLTNSRVRAQWLRSGTYMLPQVHPSRHLDVGIRMLSSADREERDGQEDLSYCIAQGPEPKGRREKCGWSWSPGVRCSSGVRQETEKESRWVLYQTVAQPTNNPKQTLGTESSHVGPSSLVHLGRRQAEGSLTWEGSQAGASSPQCHPRLVTIELRAAETQGLIQSWALIINTHEMVLLLL